MSSDTKEARPIPEPLYSCADCRGEYSWPADSLFWIEKRKAWICIACWDPESEERGESLEEYLRGLVVETYRRKGGAA